MKRQEPVLHSHYPKVFWSPYSYMYTYTQRASFSTNNNSTHEKYWKIDRDIYNRCMHILWSLPIRSKNEILIQTWIEFNSRNCWNGDHSVIAQYLRHISPKSLIVKKKKQQTNKMRWKKWISPHTRCPNARVILIW
jgi:hypothetical protein